MKKIELKELQHFKDTSRGLFVTDIEPKYILQSFLESLHLYATKGEKEKTTTARALTTEWYEWINNKKLFFQLDEPNDRQILVLIDDMCSHSLDPDTHTKWEEVKKMLINNRKNLNK